MCIHTQCNTHTRIHHVGTYMGGCTYTMCVCTYHYTNTYTNVYTYHVLHTHTMYYIHIPIGTYVPWVYIGTIYIPPYRGACEGGGTERPPPYRRGVIQGTRQAPQEALCGGAHTGGTGKAHTGGALRDPVQGGLPERGVQGRGVQQTSKKEAPCEGASVGGGVSGKGGFRNRNPHRRK